MDYKSLIPKHKSDIETAEKLFTYSYEEIKIIVSHLMAWIKDINWPVSRPVADYPDTISEYLTEEILAILKGNDDTWKYWVIHVFGFWSEKPIDEQLIPEIKRIAFSPSSNERLEEVDEVARELLEWEGYS